jgi:hypothetical protein
MRGKCTENWKNSKKNVQNVHFEENEFLLSAGFSVWSAQSSLFQCHCLWFHDLLNALKWWFVLADWKRNLWEK